MPLSEANVTARGISQIWFADWRNGGSVRPCSPNWTKARSDVPGSAHRYGSTNPAALKLYRGDRCHGKRSVIEEADALASDLLGHRVEVSPPVRVVTSILIAPCPLPPTSSGEICAPHRKIHLFQAPQRANVARATSLTFVSFATINVASETLCGAAPKSPPILLS